jgi:F0F1-type ATP synthase assembly protein I
LRPAPGVDDIEPRTLVACGLILLLLVALIAGVFYLRHNSHTRKVARRREREMALREERDSKS